MPNVTWKLLIGQPMDSRRVDTIPDPREQGVARASVLEKEVQ